MMFRRIGWYCLWAGLTLLPAAASADQSVSSGEFTAHYSAFSTDTLLPEVAKAYQIERSKKLGMLNIAVLKKVMGTTAQPVRAEVTVTATNLHDQSQQIAMRELNDHGAIYYIGEFPISHEETLRFKVDITPEGSSEPFTASFSQEFFTR
jgi:hypothetical protein